MSLTEVTLGIEIGSTHTAFGLVDISGTCYVEGKIPTKANESPESLFDRLFNKFKRIYRENADKYELIGIGIGAPGANYYTGTVEFSSNLNWGYVNIVELVKNYFDLPIVITNDANAAAIGEMKFGVAKGMKNFIQLTLSKGFGSGIVVDGNLVYGSDGFAGEIGHTIVEKNGRLCGCGRKGCLETYVSTSGLIRTFYELIAQSNEVSVLKEFPPEELTAKLIYKAALNGDKLAQTVFEFTGKILGEALANAVAYLSPEAIILSEGLAMAGDLLVKPTKYHMEANMLNIFKGKTEILLSGLTKGNAAIIGACALIWHEISKTNSLLNTDKPNTNQVLVNGNHL
ncbi:MAG: ROK family protein [Ignavibacteriales bacterium]|nr:ROK family protein [Ignavibacteriales bacterium]